MWTSSRQTGSPWVKFWRPLVNSDNSQPFSTARKLTGNLQAEFDNLHVVTDRACWLSWRIWTIVVELKLGIRQSYRTSTSLTDVIRDLHLGTFLETPTLSGTLFALLFVRSKTIFWVTSKPADYALFYISRNSSYCRFSRVSRSFSLPSRIFYSFIKVAKLKLKLKFSRIGCFNFSKHTLSWSRMKIRNRLL